MLSRFSNWIRNHVLVLLAVVAIAAVVLSLVSFQYALHGANAVQKSAYLDACRRQNQDRITIRTVSDKKDDNIQAIIDGSFGRAVQATKATINNPLSTAMQRAVATTNLALIAKQQAEIDRSIKAERRDVAQKTTAIDCRYPPR